MNIEGLEAIRCPFCGGGTIQLMVNHTLGTVFVECGDCGCSTKDVYEPGDAIELWNTRAYAPVGDISVN